MLHFRINIYGIEETQTALDNFTNQIKRQIRTSTGRLAQVGKSEMQEIFSKRGWAGGTLYNSINIEYPSQYRTLLIVSAPHAMAMDVGDVKLLPDFASLQPIQTKQGMRYLWTGLDAQMWLAEHNPKSQSQGVLVGKSIDGIPFPEGVHFSDAAMDRIEKEVVSEVIRAMFGLKFK